MSKLYITDANGDFDLSADLIKEIKEELNVKEVIENQDLSRFVKYSIKPQLKTLGPKYGALLGAIRNFFASCDANEIVKIVRSGELYKTNLNGTEVEFAESDILIAVEQSTEYSSATEGSLAVVLDTKLTEELLNEGMVREFVSKVQNLRKTSGYDVTDRIYISVDGDEDIVSTILESTNVILKDCLAISLNRSSTGEFKDEFEYNGKKATLYIRR